MQRKIAIVAIHGVIPQQRHGFADQVASALRDRLNGRTTDTNGDTTPWPGTWKTDIVFPEIPPAGPPQSPIASPPLPLAVKVTTTPTPPNGVAKAYPTDPVAAGRQSIIRVHNNEGDVIHPVGDYYDIVEVYWSPIDKHKTNALSVLTWLLGTIFAPANTTARYTGGVGKAISDVTYALAIAACGVASLVILLVATVNALHGITTAVDKPPDTTPTFWWTPLADTLTHLQTRSLGAWGEHAAARFQKALPHLWPTLVNLAHPTELSKILGVDALARLAIGVVGAYLFAQGVRAAISAYKQRRLLSSVSIQLASRIAFVCALVTSGSVLLLACASWPLPKNNVQLGFVAIALVFAAGGFLWLRSIVTTFLAEFFGDVQIYCTHDENAAFFALREDILKLTERTIVETIHQEYDRVFIFAHSLGSTIGLDALMRIYNLRVEKGIPDTAWQKLRGFITFGTSLEKTKYFLDAYGRPFSASLEKWRNDYYGAIFTADPTTLTKPNAKSPGLYWANYWYFFDFISDRIESYSSFLKPSDSISDSTNIRAQIERETDPDKTAFGKIVAQNRVDRRLPLPWKILHGEYLGAAWFWQKRVKPRPSGGGATPRRRSDDDAIGALEIVTTIESGPRGTGAVAPTTRARGGHVVHVPVADRVGETKPRSRSTFGNEIDVVHGRGPQ